MLKNCRTSHLSKRPNRLTSIWAKKAHTWAECGDADSALRVVGQIGSSPFQSVALSRIAKALINRGELENAVKFAERFDIPEWRHWMFEALTCGLAEKNEFDLAIQLSGKIDDVRIKTLALAAICLNLCRTGETAHAEEMLEQTITLSYLVPQPSLAKIRAIDVMARQLHSAAQTEHAFSLLTMAEKTARENNSARGLSDVGECLVELGQSKLALEVFLQALNFAETTEPLQERVEVLRFVARSLGKTGHPKLALQTLHHGLGILMQMPSSGWRDQELSFFTVQLGGLDDFKNALVASNEIWHAGQRTEVLFALFDRLNEVGDQKRALSVLKQALSSARQIENPEERNLTLFQIGERFALLGAWKRARNIAKEIEAPAKSAI